MNGPVLECHRLKKSFSLGGQVVEVLKGIDFQLHPGERVAIMGASGAGKTTLLSILGGLERTTSGRVTMAGAELSRLSANQLAHRRMRTIGFVYQFHHLLMEFTAEENVIIPLILARVSPRRAQERARRMLEEVRLSQRAAHKPAELSGGERQRVAVARALVIQPACILMDEPTGNLDEKTAQGIHQLIDSLSRKIGTALLVVTHNQRLAERMDRIHVLVGGRIHG